MSIIMGSKEESDELERRKVAALESISSRLWWCALWLFLIFSCISSISTTISK